MTKAKAKISSKWDNSGETEQNNQIQPRENKTEHSAIYTGGFVLQPREKPEAKTRRVNTAFRPSSYERFVQIARKSGYSANELLNQLVEDFVKSADWHEQHH